MLAGVIVCERIRGRLRAIVGMRATAERDRVLIYFNVSTTITMSTAVLAPINAAGR